MNEPGSSQKDGLLKILEETKSNSAFGREQAQGIAQTLYVTEQLAGVVKQIVEAAPDDTALPVGTWARLGDVFSAHNRTAQDFSLSLLAGVSLSATTQAATLTTSLTLPEFSGWISRAPPAAVAELHAILNRPELMDDVRALFRRFGLDRATANTRAPMDLIEEARVALDQPSGAMPAATAVLLAARSSIDNSLASLLLRRPAQEKTGKASFKVLSIGGQCAVGGLPVGHFKRLAEDADQLVNDLSGGKERVYTNGELARLFAEVLQFHTAFLTALDPTKLRN